MKCEASGRGFEPALGPLFSQVLLRLFLFRSIFYARGLGTGFFLRFQSVLTFTACNLAASLNGIPPSTAQNAAHNGSIQFKIRISS